MTCRLTTRMAKLGFDLQEAVVNIYALMLQLLGEHPAPPGHRNKEHPAPTGQHDHGYPAPTENPNN
jgi:hypothetical protein